MGVKKVEYNECDCGGKVTPITSTQISWGTACGDGGDSTEYFECDKCHTLYERRRSISGNYLSNEPDSLSNFHEYKNGLTKEELMVFAPMKHGGLYKWDAEKIIASRSMIKEAQEIWSRLNTSTSQDVAGDLMKFETFCREFVYSYYNLRMLFSNGTGNWQKKLNEYQDKFERERRARRI